MSGGVDSSVVAFLINRAVGNNLVCVFVDNGLLRKNEFENVLKSYQNLGLKVIETYLILVLMIVNFHYQRHKTLYYSISIF